MYDYHLAIKFLNEYSKTEKKFCSSAKNCLRNLLKNCSKSEFDINFIINCNFSY